MSGAWSHHEPDLLRAALALEFDIAAAVLAGFTSAPRAADPGTSLARQNLSVDRSLSTGGANAWNLVAQDALGRSEQIGAPMIADTRLAGRGCPDFSIGFGKVRRDYALDTGSSCLGGASQIQASV